MKKIIVWSFLGITLNVQALPADSLGDISDKLMLPMSVLASGVYNVSLGIGIALLFGTLIQYRNHRQNPGQVPISRPVTLLIFGLIFLSLPFLAKLSESAFLVSRS
jgi:hypothetical protein